MSGPAVSNEKASESPPLGNAGEATIWTPKNLLEWSEAYFSTKGVPTPRLDAEILLAHVLAVERIQLYLQFDRPLNPDELAAYRALVKARAARKPVAYLVGEVGFWNLTLAISEGCLIPSPDTETLVEAILEAIGSLRAQHPDKPLNILELGVGSGVLPLAVCSEAKNLSWVGTERSPVALAVAVKNRRRHKELLTPRENALYLVQADRFEPITPTFSPHLIVGNPPYIPSGVIDRLMPEVSKAEPRMALDGGADGLRFHRYIMAHAARTMPRDGRILLEMGAEQSEEMKQIVGGVDGLEMVKVHADLAGHPRVTHARHQ